MQYYIARNGEKLGPFTREEVYQRLAVGQLAGNDLGWHQGMDDWQPLLQLLPPPATPGMPASPVFATRPAQPAQTSGLAVASLICGIIGFFTVIPALPAVIMGHMARARIRRSSGRLGGGGMALAGLIIGYLTLATLAGVSVFVGMEASKLQELSKRARAASDLQELRTVLLIYEERGEHLPTTEQGLEALVTKPASGFVPPNWEQLLGTIRPDPWGRPYQYRTPATRTKNRFDVFSMGPDGVPDTPDDVDGWLMK